MICCVLQSFEELTYYFRLFSESQWRSSLLLAWRPSAWLSVVSEKPTIMQSWDIIEQVAKGKELEKKFGSLLNHYIHILMHFTYGILANLCRMEKLRGWKLWWELCICYVGIRNSEVNIIRGTIVSTIKLEPPKRRKKSVKSFIQTYYSYHSSSIWSHSQGSELPSLLQCPGNSRISIEFHWLVGAPPKLVRAGRVWLEVVIVTRADHDQTFTLTTASCLVWI